MGTSPSEEEGSPPSLAFTSSDKSWDKMDQDQTPDPPTDAKNTEDTGTGGDGDTVMVTVT